MNYYQTLVTLLWCSVTHQAAIAAELKLTDGADIAFLIDSSRSISYNNFAVEKDFVKRIMAELASDCTKFNAAVVSFSTSASVWLDFSEIFNLQRFLFAMDELRHELGGRTRIDKALIVTSERLFTSSRQQVSKIAILITDGQNTIEPDTVPLYEASQSLKYKGVRIFVIGVGYNVYVPELLEITERPENLILTTQFSELRVDDVVTKIRSAIGPPALVTITESYTRYKSRLSATLRCRADGLGKQQLPFYNWQWKFQGQGIKENRKYNISDNYRPPNFCLQSKGSTSLHITNVSEEDFGQYTCALLLSNITIAEKEIPFNTLAALPPKIEKLESIKCGRAIKVEWSPPPITEPENNPITGYELILKSVSEYLELTYILSSKEELKTEFSGLKINAVYEVNLRAKDSTGFGLWAKQQLSTTTDVPSGLTVRANPLGCSAQLSWNTPLTNNCPITQYTIYYRESKISENVESEWRNPNLNGLNKTVYRLWLNCSKNYDVMVMAWNRNGHNDFSDESVVTILTENGVPFQPLVTDIKQQQCGALEISWKPSDLDSGGGPLTGFQVQITKKNDDNWHNCSTFLTNETCSFDGLFSKTDYHIRIRAINLKGPSEWKNDSIRTGVIGPPNAPEILYNMSKVTDRNVTVTWTRPQHNNCSITMYSVHYRMTEPTTESWKQINITDLHITRYELHLQYSRKYQLIVFAWNKLGRSVGSRLWEVKTEQDVPYQPILYQPILGQCNTVNITWSPPTREALGDPVTSYVAQIRRARSKETWINCTSLSTSIPTSCLFTNLKKSTDYDTRVIAKNKIGYSLPSNIEEISTSQADQPGRPEIVEREVSGCNVTLEWTSPLSNYCPILFYTISYRQKGTSRGVNNWTVINVTDATVNQKELVLNCSATYEFQARAWNELGGGTLSPIRSATTSRQGNEELPTTDPSVGNNTLLTAFTVAFVILVVLLLIIFGGYYQKNRSRKRPKRTFRDIQVLEQCEVHPIRTEFAELLGEGAFGKVHKARLKDGLDFFKNNEEFVHKTWRQKIVAVKELHESANEEQRSEFLDEIELMKQVGKHQNVLSFLGCWTTTKPFLLIIEYVAHGDLLHWLRSKRIQIQSSTGGNAGQKDLDAGNRTLLPRTTVDQASGEHEKGIDIPEDICNPSLPPDDTEQPVSDECEIPLVVFQGVDASSEKKDDECSDDCESFIPTDLMTMAWQIAKGMTYLSGKGLVHRDLAARNILVGHGKRLKIADFGLMREVYHEMYEVKKQKKLPIKWMAPESIYEQIFTSKSDVWSYGVVMWEIATVGGSPYPLLSNKELMKRLKTGYRMEKPDLCSDHVYSLMLDCWKQDQGERPSFQELVKSLEELMLQEVEYFDFDKVDESRDYYNVLESKTEDDDGDGDDEFKTI